MALAMNQYTFHDLDLSDRSTSDEANLPQNCKYWSHPVVDWQSDDFQDLIDPLMDDDDDAPYPYPHPIEMVKATNCSSELLSTPKGDGEEDQNLKGIRLYHLLMATVDAMYGEHKSRDLAHVILVRLKELVSPIHGTNLERLAAYYTEAFQGLLECTFATNTTTLASYYKPHHRDDLSPKDMLLAFQLLQEMSPYVKFGHFIANQAILEAVTNDRRVHIIDYDIMEGIQWASLMQALVSRKDGPPSPHLRITAISRGGNANNRKFIGTVQETGRRLVAFAASIGQPFSFHQCKLEFDETFRPSNLKLVKGEALIINCMLNLPHFTCRTSESISSFLCGAKSLGPRLVTLGEEEVGYGYGPANSRDVDCKVQLFDSMECYLAIYDSLDVGFPIKSKARILVEQVFLGPRIIATVKRISQQQRTEEENNSWGERLGKMGFKEVGISFANHCQVRLLLGLFNDGYRVEEVSKNKLVLGWKSKRLLSTSIWAFDPFHSN